MHKNVHIFHIISSYDFIITGNKCLLFLPFHLSLTIHLVQNIEKEGIKMNLAKRAAAWFLALVMVLGLVPQTVFAKENSEIAKLSITYHLNTEDGNMIAEPYYADMPKGSSYDVISPEIDNYVLKNPEQEKVSGVLKGDTEIKVVYSYDTTNEVPYKINYVGVNNQGQETILETVTEKAPVDTVISIPFKEFKGYDKRSGEDMKLIVTADGQAEKNVYYDRTAKTYIIFNTNGSYVEPIIAEEGEDISNEISKIEEPTRQGYEFAGWDKELPTTMPERRLHCECEMVGRNERLYCTVLV